MMIQHLTCIVSYEKSHLYLLFLSTCLFFALGFYKIFLLITCFEHFYCNVLCCSLSGQSYGFSSSHVWMWELDHKAEGWRIDFWTVVLEKTLESPLDCKIKPVHPKGNHSWIFIGRIDAEAETPILWPPDGKNWLIGKDPDAGKGWSQEEKGPTEDEMVGDGWMTSPTPWTWDWASSRSWWWTGKPGMLQSMGLRWVRHDWAELNWCCFVSCGWGLLSVLDLWFFIRFGKLSAIIFSDIFFCPSHSLCWGLQFHRGC